jgi:hypothetical protein
MHKAFPVLYKETKITQQALPQKLSIQFSIFSLILIALFILFVLFILSVLFIHSFHSFHSLHSLHTLHSLHSIISLLFFRMLSFLTSLICHMPYLQGMELLDDLLPGDPAGLYCLNKQYLNPKKLHFQH